MVSFTCCNGIEALQKLVALDLVFVDPPWMAGDREANGFKYADSYTRAEYVELYCHGITMAAERALVEGGTLAVWVDYRAAPYWGVAMDDSGLNRCGEIIIESGLGNPGRAHWPMKHSNILLAYNGSEQRFNPDALPMVPRLAASKVVGDTVYSGDKRIASVIQHTLSNTAGERCDYPDQKPLYVCKLIIEAFTAPGGTVVDPCCGSGSIPIAAHMSGRVGIGYDLSQAAITLASGRAEARQQSFLFR